MFSVTVYFVSHQQYGILQQGSALKIWSSNITAQSGVLKLTRHCYWAAAQKAWSRCGTSRLLRCWKWDKFNSILFLLENILRLFFMEQFIVNLLHRLTVWELFYMSNKTTMCNKSESKIPFLSHRLLMPTRVQWSACSLIAIILWQGTLTARSWRGAPMLMSKAA